MLLYSHNMAAIFQHGRRRLYRNATFDLNDGSRQFPLFDGVHFSKNYADLTKWNWYETFSITAICEKLAACASLKCVVALKFGQKRL